MPSRDDPISPHPRGAPDKLAATLSAVRTNCHISDARHATDYTLCVYLLKMREYYRWEKDLPFNAALPHDELTLWLTEREAFWKTLEEKSFRHVPIFEQLHDPFDAQGINDVLNRRGYVYSGGIGPNMKPHFFLGALKERRLHQGYTLYVCGRELARDLAAPPAMSLGRTIFIRRESLRRMLWEKIEEWRWNRPANAMQKAIGCYDFERAPEQALEHMTERETRSVLLHEIGEVMAGEALGGCWEELLLEMPHCKAALMMRAVRDHLADALSTLPGLLDEAEPASLHFYMANLTNMRKMLFPGLLAAYGHWSQTGRLDRLMELTEVSGPHWLNLAQEIVSLHGSGMRDLQDKVVALVERNTL